MKIPGLSERLLEHHAERGSVERGKEYYEDGAVRSLKRSSETEVEAFVQGTDVAPYQVTIRHDADGIVKASCTCPYVKGSWCRHIVAALLAAMDGEGTLTRPIDEMLDAFDRTELLRLIERMIDEQPELTSMLEDAYRQKQSS